MIREPVLFPRMYGFYVALATLDILLTAWILRLGGLEFNPVGAFAFEAGGITGATILKFATVVIFVLICERIGRDRAELGRTLAYIAVCISIVPVTVGSLELFDAWQYGLLAAF